MQHKDNFFLNDNRTKNCSQTNDIANSRQTLSKKRAPRILASPCHGGSKSWLPLSLNFTRVVESDFELFYNGSFNKLQPLEPLLSTTATVFGGEAIGTGGRQGRFQPTVRTCAGGRAGCACTVVRPAAPPRA
jgi:hypothetical protein